MTVRVLTILAVFLSGSLGLNNGMVLHAHGDGHLGLDAPGFSHAVSHAHGADHEPHDFGGESDHKDLHDRIEAASGLSATSQKVERASSSLAVNDAAPLVLAAGLGAPPSPRLGVPAHAPGRDATTWRGSTAHLALTCLRAVILIV